MGRTRLQDTSGAALEESRLWVSFSLMLPLRHALAPLLDLRGLFSSFSVASR